MPRRPGQERQRLVGVYFPTPILKEMQAEAKRLDRSLAWVAQRAWKEAAKKLHALPSQAVGGAVCGYCGEGTHRPRTCPKKRDGS